MRQEDLPRRTIWNWAVSSSKNFPPEMYEVNLPKQETLKMKIFASFTPTNETMQRKRSGRCCFKDRKPQGGRGGSAVETESGAASVQSVPWSGDGMNKGDITERQRASERAERENERAEPLSFKGRAQPGKDRDLIDPSGRLFPETGHKNQLDENGMSIIDISLLHHPRTDLLSI